MPTIYPLPGAEQTLIAEFAAYWHCSIVDAEQRLIQMALEQIPDPGIERDENVYQLPSEKQP